MDFELSEDQEALAEGVASLCEGRFDIDAIRAMEHDGLDRGRWTELAETGVFALCLDEGAGGVGLGWAEAAVVFESTRLSTDSPENCIPAASSSSR